MTLQGINAVFRENKEGRVYGLTFIDNKSGAHKTISDLQRLGYIQYQPSFHPHEGSIISMI